MFPVILPEGQRKRPSSSWQTLLMGDRWRGWKAPATETGGSRSRRRCSCLAISGLEFRRKKCGLTHWRSRQRLSCVWEVWQYLRWRKEFSDSLWDKKIFHPASYEENHSQLENKLVLFALLWDQTVAKFQLNHLRWYYNNDPKYVVSASRVQD